MDLRIKFGIWAIAIVWLSACLSSAGILRVGGVAPNITVVALIVLSFFTENLIFYGLLSLGAATLIRFEPLVFDAAALATFVVAIGAFLAQRRIVWPNLIGVMLLVPIGTLMVYALVNPAFIVELPFILLMEMIYNLILGVVLFEVIQRVAGRYGYAA